MKPRSLRPRSTKPLSDYWDKKIRKMIKEKEFVRDQQERKQITGLLNRKEMKLALGSLLAEIKKHPNTEEYYEDPLQLIWHVLDYCIVSRNMPKDIPPCLWNQKALTKVAIQTKELAAQFGDIAKVGLFIGYPGGEDKSVDIGVVAKLLAWLSNNLQSIASNPETLQIIRAGMFPNLKPGRGNRPDLRVWRLVHGLAMIFFNRFEDPRYEIVAQFHNAIFKTKSSVSDVKKIHLRMIVKGMTPTSLPGYDSQERAI